MDAEAEKLAVADTLLILVGQFGTVGVYRVQGESPPVFRGETKTGDLALDVIVQGSRSFVANGASGVMVLDLTQPTDPRIVSALPLDGVCHRIAPFGHYLLVAAGVGGLHVVDIAVPTAPVFRATLDTPGFASYVSATGSTAYVADESAGVHVVDLLDPSHPRFVGTLRTNGRAVGVAGTDLFLYAADLADGLVTARAQCANR